MASSRLRVLSVLLAVVGLSILIPACGDEEVPAPTTPAPAPTPTPPAPAPEPTPDPPAVPTGLRISASGETFIEWSWTPVPEVSGYDVQYSTNEAFTDEDEVIERTAEQISYRREGLAAETPGYLRVRSAAGTGDDRVTSGWSTHLTGMTTPAEPTVPAAPTNVQVTDRGRDYLVWSWDEVAGAAGYHAQYSGTTAFSDDSPAVHPSGTTTGRITGLEASTAYHLRVRARFGTRSEAVYGSWSATSQGRTTESAPAPPAPTQLARPTGLTAGTPTRNSIPLEWDEVDDVDRYQVQQQAEGASWGNARCDGSDNEVNDEACVATGLEQGTRYDFRVRAVPAASATGLAASPWSSEITATTTGRPAITLEDGGLNLRWSSEWDTSTATAAYAITWRWDPVEDRALQPLVDHYVALLSPIDADGAARPRGERECPSLDRNVTATDTVTDTAANYGDWFNLDSDISATVRPVTSAADGAGSGNAGEVRGLCVVRTWEDNRGIRQFSEVSLAWATTLPSSPLGDSNPINRENAVTRATTSINWDYDVDAGFTYVLGLLSTSRDSDAPDDVADCTGARNVPSPREVNTHNFRVSHRLQSVAPYSNYRLCIRAENDLGASDWAFVGGATGSVPPTYLGATAATRPAAPSAPTYDAGESEVTTEAYGGHDVNRMVWSVSHKTGTPLSGTAATTRGGHEYKVLRRTTGGSISGSAIQTTCETGTGIGTPTARNFGDGFEIQLEADIVSDTAVASAPGAYYVYACVRADATSADTDDHGPWSISSPRGFAAGVPADVGFSAATDTDTVRSVTLSFTDIGGATYDVQLRYVSGDNSSTSPPSNATSATVTKGTATRDVTGLTAATTYTFWVRYTLRAGGRTLYGDDWQRTTAASSAASN